MLLARSYAAVADREPDGDAVVASATAVELLREYHRLRGELLVQIDETAAHASNGIRPTRCWLAIISLRPPSEHFGRTET